MQGTASWYCAKCSRFIEHAHRSCDSCGRIRGSARHQAQREEPNLYWIRVAQGKGPERPRRANPPS